MKVAISLLLIVFFLYGGYEFFISDYGNSDYYKPVQLILVKKLDVKVYPTFRDCYLGQNNWRLYNGQKDSIRVIYFQRDLRDGSCCFKVEINQNNFGFISAVGDANIDSMPINANSQTFKKTVWPF